MLEHLWYTNGRHVFLGNGSLIYSRRDKSLSLFRVNHQFCSSSILFFYNVKNRRKRITVIQEDLFISYCPAAFLSLSFSLSVFLRADCQHPVSWNHQPSNTVTKVNPFCEQDILQKKKKRKKKAEHDSGVFIYWPEYIDEKKIRTPAERQAETPPFVQSAYIKSAFILSTWTARAMFGWWVKHQQPVWQIIRNRLISSNKAEILVSKNVPRCYNKKSCCHRNSRIRKQNRLQLLFFFANRCNYVCARHLQYLLWLAPFLPNHHIVQLRPCCWDTDRITTGGRRENKHLLHLVSIADKHVNLW